MMRHTSFARRGLVITVSALTLLAACSSDSTAKHRATPTTRPPSARVIATMGKLDMAVGGPQLVGLADSDRKAILAAIQRYVAVATMRPLNGKGTAALAAQLTASAAPALSGPDHDALEDAGIAKATGAIKAVLAPINLTALSDQGGAVDLVGATFDLTVNAEATAGPLTIHRSGELMFTRDGGTWKILGFTLAVTRSGDGIGTTPTSKPPSTSRSSAP